MISYAKSADMVLPIRLEIWGATNVTGKAAADLTVKLANKDSADWESLTATTHYTLNELSEGDYSLTILAAVNDTTGHVRVKISGTGFDTKQYVVYVDPKLDAAIDSNNRVDVGKLLGTAVSANVPANLNTVYENGGVATTKTVDTLGATAADIDTVLSGTHGEGSWAGATADDIDTELSANHGSGAWGAGSTGANSVVVTITDANDVVLTSAKVSVLNSSQTVLYDAKYTDSNGQVTFALDDGTFKVRVVKAGYSFTVPETLTVSGDTTDTYKGTQVSLSGDNFNNRKYADFHKWLDDWLMGEGGEVSDLTLSLINRAQDELWQYRPWEGLVKNSTLTVSSKAASLPSDFGRMLDVYHDTDADGKPDYHYYNNGEYDNGYRYADSFTKAGGHSRTITFYRNPTYTPKIFYQAVLDDFTAVGDEYTYFPANLLILTAQKIHIVESDMVGKEYEAILNEQAKQLRDYEQSHNWINIDMKQIQNDTYGAPLENSQFNLDTADEGRFQNTLPNSYDFG